MEPSFRLLTFGGLTLLRDGVPVSGTLSQRKRLALLAVLAATPKAVIREAAIALLWPESDEERGRNSLAQVVHGLRREIGESVVGGTNGSLSLDPERLACDLGEFRSAIQGGHYAAAVELYRGPFLDGVHLREAPDFERWCEQQRGDLARSYTTALRSLAEGSTRRRNWTEAASWWRKCADADPLSGRIARSYMEALAADGKREEAIRHGELYAELVRAELGAEPDASAMAFADELRRTRGLDRAATPNTTLVVAPDAPNGFDHAPQLALAEVSVAPSAGTSTAGTRLRPAVSRRWLAYATIALVAAAGLAAVNLKRQPRFIDNRVVVAAFENRTGDSRLDQLGFMAADLITQGLQQTKLVDVADPTASRAAAPSARSRQDPLGDPHAIRAIGLEARARVVVTGSYYRHGDSLVMVASVSDARDDKVLDALVPASVVADAPASVIDLTRERVLGAVAMRFDKRLDPIIPPGSTSPPTYTAYLAFMEGLAAHQLRKRRLALASYTQAIASDSTFVLPHVWKVWLNVPTSAAADSTLRYLNSKRESLAPLDRIAVDYQTASARRDLRSKVALAQEALALAPRSHWAHNLGFSLTDMGRLAEAVDAYEQIDRRGGWTRGWLEYWARFIDALHIGGYHTRELEVAREARRVFPTSAVPVFFEARALATMDSVRELDVVIKELLAHKEAENSATFGMQLALLARELETAGDTIAARHLFDRAIA